ncbi:MAG: hypothetical protein ACKV19_12635 [Verrucomicrobiales bacterium]
MLNSKPRTLNAQWIQFVWVVVALFLGCEAAFGNPLPNPTSSLQFGAMAGVGLIAIGVEVALLAKVLLAIYQPVRTFPTILCLVLLNIATYALFVVWIHPKLGNTIVTEFFVWLAEGFGIAMIMRKVAEERVSVRTALAFSFIGNLISYLIGESFYSPT